MTRWDYSVEEEVDYVVDPIVDPVDEARASGTVTEAAKAIFQDVIALACSVEEWKKGLPNCQFAFADYASTAKANSKTPHEILEFYISTIEDNTYPPGRRHPLQDIQVQQDQHPPSHFDRCHTRLALGIRTRSAACLIHPCLRLFRQALRLVRAGSLQVRDELCNNAWPGCGGDMEDLQRAEGLPSLQGYGGGSGLLKEGSRKATTAVKGGVWTVGAESRQSCALGKANWYGISSWHRVARGTIFTGIHLSQIEIRSSRDCIHNNCRGAGYIIGPIIGVVIVILLVAFCTGGRKKKNEEEIEKMGDQRLAAAARNDIVTVKYILLQQEQKVSLLLRDRYRCFAKDRTDPPTWRIRGF
ncbi:hypothetical protein BU23DRAFT_574903 [Bimuria novae-zelandiae CBS 107.79]|uniref:Uncharacterized protein n=1 Tax=Bimuria novae-zelandiae CBS 107.79 TaxID=1447943 RepID=A0A6A5UL89_9PLEO|nr:hypothetical protein BU23DRAFT_574903 [Bimuria novae-zelandiae CBS 107.79]